MRGHIVMYCDAVGNFETRRGVDGSLVRDRLPGHRAGVVACASSGEVIGSGLYVNSVCPDQYAAACWAVLRAIETAVELNAEIVTIRTQQVEDLGSSTRQGYRGSRYLEIAREIVWHRRVRCIFEHLHTDDLNLAEFVARDAMRGPGSFVRYRERMDEVANAPARGEAAPLKHPPVGSLIRSDEC